MGHMETANEFYRKIGAENLAPLWHMMDNLVPREPSPAAVPAHWSYSEIRPRLLQAASIVGTDEAERRVLMLENPSLPGEARTTGSLYAGVQILMPGETARTHRHAASALRFVLESAGGWTSVNGERTIMHPGDFVVTPAWKWHDHGNDGDVPAIWLDGLDIHIVNLLDCGFREDATDCPPIPERPADAALLEFGANLLPIDYPSDGVSPIFNYPYSRTREALAGIARHRDVDASDGFKMRYVNPLNGDWAIRTIATWIQLLPSGFQGVSRRSTDGMVLVVVEGEGRSRIGGDTFNWSKGDILVVPSWAEVSHFAASEAVLFGASDRATQEKLGLWRQRTS